MAGLMLMLLLVLGGCQGLYTAGNPPDPSIAASGSWAFQSVNSAPPFGGNLDTVTAVSLTARGPGDDRRIYYDRWADRWFTIGLGYNDGVYVSASSGNDPTGWWYPYTYLVPGVPDQPTMGFAQNVAIMVDRI